MSRHIIGTPCHIHLLNIYAPCHNFSTFSYQIQQCNLIKISGFIIVGDLNVTLMAQESWGKNNRPDPLVNHPYNLFIDYNLVEICPFLLSPTSNNQRVGEEHVGKCLD